MERWGHAEMEPIVSYPKNLLLIQKSYHSRESIATVKLHPTFKSFKIVFLFQEKLAYLKKK